MISAPYITQQMSAFNALFIQPTPWCARNCNGCYVKGFEKLQGISDSNFVLMGDIISEIGRSIQVNQVTFALDKKPVPAYTSGPMSVNSPATQMQALADYFMGRLQTCESDTEFHMTVHTVSDLHEYGFHHRTYSYPKKLHMLSISHINEKDVSTFTYIRETIAQSINWNLTIDPSVNLKHIKSTFHHVAMHVDTIYLVLHKPSTGKLFDPEAFEMHQDFVRFIKTLPDYIQKKVHIDGCIHDSYKFIRTGYGCSSNVSRFQVWPDGSVTGCAYNQNRVTPPAETMHDLHYNFWLASKKYEFDKCKIPNHLEPKHPRVTSRHKHYLEIIE